MVMAPFVFSFESSKRRRTISPAQIRRFSLHGKMGMHFSYPCGLKNAIEKADYIPLDSARGLYYG
jgi:hypothetical protein